MNYFYIISRDFTHILQLSGFSSWGELEITEDEAYILAGYIRVLSYEEELSYFPSKYSRIPIINCIVHWKMYSFI